MGEDTIKIGGSYRFDYPPEFKTLPEYTAHAGQTVAVIRELTSEEADAGEVGRMYKVRAADGWEADAFEDELKPLA